MSTTILLAENWNVTDWKWWHVISWQCISHHFLHPESRTALAAGVFAARWLCFFPVSPLTDVTLLLCCLLNGLLFIYRVPLQAWSIPLISKDLHDHVSGLLHELLCVCLTPGIFRSSSLMPQQQKLMCLLLIYYLGRVPGQSRHLSITSHRYPGGIGVSRSQGVVLASTVYFCMGVATAASGSLSQTLRTCGFYRDPDLWAYLRTL